MAEPSADREQILRTLQVLLDPGQVVKLRALDVSTRDFRRPHVASGYFGDFSAMADAALRLTPVAKGVYVTPNMFNPALLARAANRIRPIDREPLTSDADVLRRC
jgi:hypothetical protein